jgi:hypothetical protein
MEEGRATGVRPRTDPTQDKDQDKGQEGPRQGHPRQDKDKTRTPTTSSGVKTRTPTTSSGNGTGHSSIRTLNAVPVSDHDGETLQRSGQRDIGIFRILGVPDFMSWPASKNPTPSAPSSPTSQSTARWRKRTTGPDRAAHRPWPRPRSRKIGHATNRDNQQPVDAAAIPQGRAWPDAWIQ